jgi:hypothetical protein
MIQQRIKTSLDNKSFFEVAATKDYYQASSHPLNGYVVKAGQTA